LRVGIGYDVHQLKQGEELILGGVAIAHDYGLKGHSDADVLIHAIIDALLGAAGLGDIGRMFPDTNEQYKGISSMQLLTEVMDRLETHGYRINNIDATIIAQAPKLRNYLESMENNIANTLKISAEAVNVKATTTERLGFVGREEGIAAEAVTLLFY
jgi:2-C-methyl-D-erythritol 2,4-cyclodiphosphate synthase